MANRQTPPLTESQEDYLEAIFQISRSTERVGVTDIATRLHVRKPSVTAALKSLSEKGLVIHAAYQGVALTQNGIRLASRIAERHAALKTIFEEQLGLNSKLANQNACRMEHALDPDVLDKLIRCLQSRA